MKNKAEKIIVEFVTASVAFNKTRKKDIAKFYAGEDETLQLKRFCKAHDALYDMAQSLSKRKKVKPSARK